MSDIAELTAVIRIDDVQFASEQSRLIKLSDQLNIKFDQIKQTVSGYAKKINTASVETKRLTKNQSSLASFTDVTAAALNKSNTSLSKVSEKYKRLSKSVLQAKSAFEAFAGVSVATASLGTVEQFRSEINKLKDDLKIKTDLAVNIKMGDSAGFVTEHTKVLNLLDQATTKVNLATKAFSAYNQKFKALNTITKNWLQSQEKADTNIEKMTAAAEQNAAVTSKWTQNLQALQKEVTQLKVSSKEMASIGLVPGSAKEVKHVRGEVEKLKGELDKVKATAPELKNAFSSIAKYAIGAFSINEVKGMMDAYTTLTNRIKLVTNSEKQLKEVRAELARISSSTGQNLDATAAIYQRLAQATDQTGLSGEKLLTITDLVSKAMVIGGGSAQSQENALIQLGQAMASGRLSGEELNSVLEQAPGLAMAIAKGMGVSVGALKTLGSSGKITSQQLADAILKQSTQIQSDFSKTSRTIDQALQNIKTQLTMFIGGSGEATGAAKILTTALQAVANNIDLIATAVVGFLGLKLAAYLLATTAEVAAFTASLVLQASVATKAAQANGVYAASLGAIKSSAAVQNILSIKDSVKQLGVAITALRATAIGGFATVASVAAAATFSVYEAGKSINALLNDQDPHNTLSNTFDSLLRKVGWLTNDVDTLGTRLYDLLHNAAGKFHLSGLFRLKTDEEENAAKEKEQQRKEYEAKQKDPKTADLSKEAVDIKDNLQKLAKNTEKAANELGKSKEQLARENADRLLEQFKSKTQNAEAIKAAEEYTARAKAAATKLEIGELSQSITEAHTRIAETVKNFGKTSEEIEISKQQIALETMARKGATAVEVEAAKAKVEDTKKLYDHQKALEAEQKNREENTKYIQDMKTKAAELAAEVSGGKDGLIAFQLAVKNASAETIRQAQATNKVVEQLQAQLQITQTLTSLSDQVAKLGMNDTQKQLYDLKKQGATSEQLNMAKYYLDQIERDKQLQDKTRKAAEKLDTAAVSLTETAKSVGNISMFSKEARAREEAEWDKKRQEEKDSSAIGFFTGKEQVDNLTVGKLNLPDFNKDLGLAGLKIDGKGDAKGKMFELMQASKIEAQNLFVSNKMASETSGRTPETKQKSGSVETLKIDFSYNGKKIIGEVLANPNFTKALRHFFENMIADLAKNLA
ncbi:MULTISPECIES: tape measure protein [unclassified Snodgrassella]|uniref:tape measure protein n=1 Tax=unclassified Snodgrassella TaxID=2625236 RepID=UPI0018DD2ED6|nr:MULTISPECIES: tape measure protein [unclassified Snodgrassella]MBI0097222.1 tape measure protein [Snodgrassella sp. W8134]MBI0101045.1 tape measure protein [Snodgrassella sp. W8135]